MFLASSSGSPVQVKKVIINSIPLSASILAISFEQRTSFAKMSQDPLGTASRLVTSVSHALGQLLDVIRTGDGRSMEFRTQTMVSDMDIILVVPLDIITHFTALYLTS